jgi:geranylgeranyl diphosphate synthase type II
VTEKSLSIFAKEAKIVGEKLSKIGENRRPKSLYEPCQYILQNPGKRLRPFLVLAFSQLYNNNKSKPYNAALAVELLHNFSLVHDDIMDNSDTRRGRMTLHVKYDLSVAILAGDNLLALAYEYLLKDCKGNRGIEAAKKFTQCLIEICEGQSLDKDFEMRTDVAIDEYFTMISKKTAALFKMCCEIGSIIGNADKKAISSAAKYGYYLGIAFQLMDDLLDVTGDEVEVGKPLGSDLIEAKKTFLLLKSLELANNSDKDKLLKLIKNNGISKEEIQEYKNIYERCGTISIAQNEIEKYTDLAIKSLKNAANEKIKETLISIALHMAKRSK